VKPKDHERDYKATKVLISANRQLPGVDELVMCIKTLFANVDELVVRKQPDKQNILDKLNKDYDVYFFIGHGQSDSSFPERSFVEMTVKNSITFESKTYPLMLRDLVALDWSNARLICLIGCETGSGKVYRGSGIVGLQRYFVELGANNVLASLWKIDVAQTVPDIQYFLELLISTGSPADALHKSQINSMETLSNSRYFNYQHPYLWGGFTLLSTQIN
jgi:CHAT domain-containing protein